MPNIIYAFLLLVIGGFTKNKYAHHAIILVLAFLFCTRPETIPDTEIYRMIYDNPWYSKERPSYDIGFILLNSFCLDYLHLGFSTYLFGITCTLMELWYYASKKIFPEGNMGLLLLLFMSYFGFFYLGIVLRNAIALVLCYLAIAYYVQSQHHFFYRYMLIVILAALFHKSSVLFLIVPFILKHNFSPQQYKYWFWGSIILIPMGSITIVSRVLGILGGYTNQFERYNIYLQSEEKKLLTATFLLFAMISYVAVIGRKWIKTELTNLYDIFLKLILIGFSVYCMLWMMTAITRLTGIFFFFSSAVLYMVVFESRKEVIHERKLLAIILATILFGVLIYTNSTLLNY